MKKCRLFLTTAFLLGCLFFANAAKVITVTNAKDSDAGSLRKAVTDAVAGDTIRFDSEALEDETILITSDPITIDKNLVIDGEDLNITISGGGSKQLFTVNTSNRIVFISNLTLEKGNASDGGAIRIVSTGSVFTFTNVRFIDNEATDPATGGGAIKAPANDAALLYINNCYFAGNSALGGGGAIYGSKTNLIVSNSIFENNSASGTATYAGGGAICGQKITVIGSIFKNNASTQHGAILPYYSSNGLDVKLLGNTFIGNSTTSTSYGGVLSTTKQGTALLAANIFQDNTSVTPAYNEFYHSNANFTITSNGYNVFKGTSVPSDGTNTWTSGLTDAFYDGDIVDAATGKLVTNPPAVVTISETTELIEGLSKPAKDIWGNTWGTPYNAGADQTRTATPVALSNPETAAASVSVRYGDITISGASAGSTVKVYNLQGQLLKTQQVSAEVEVLKTAAWPKGIYVVVVESDQQEVLKEKVAL